MNHSLSPPRQRRPAQTGCAWRRRLLVAGWFLLVALATNRGWTQEARPLEYQVKGAFLPKLALFAEWPKSAVPKGKEPLVIGILGTDPFGPALETALATQNVGGHSLRVQRFRNVAEVAAGTCHLLFISTSEQEKFSEIVQSLRGRPILTVGDQDRFCARGGMVNFIKEDGKIRFEVNAEATAASGITLSAKFLQVSRVISGK